ncbi:carbohydrate-binding protein [Corallococcus exiguus]|uniref:Carbohydrate-binding protein n=2 Tax=Corallococcus exiguus TaxID=83462 RepID=A0A7X4Y4X5_9BACT|nr:polysaccharide lyase [Corallococcus exiguus]NBC38975.1 carbohydrate-binding protein [Corallococcus exiguus]TNV60892.1 carbohydrate-binding protein [Corallococcus exiguus]
MKRLLQLVAAASLMPALSFAGVIWKGDFETGNTSQWTRQQAVANSRLQVVTDVVRDGRYALKATVKQGDDPINASGNRNELLYLTHETQGKEYYYKWSTLFPSNYPVHDSWQVITQWHQESCCGSPPLEFFVRGDKINLRVGGNTTPVLWQTSIDKGNWHDFVLHVKWSSDKKAGFVELWHNGEHVLPKTYGANQFGKELNYLKMGLYRDAAIKPEGAIFHDGFTMATTLEDVMPPAPAPVEEPAPAPTPVPDDTTIPAEDPTPVTETPVTQTPQLPTTQLPTVGGQTPTPTPVSNNPNGLPDSSEGVAGGCSASGTSGTLPFAGALLMLGAIALRRRRAPARAVARRARR